MDSGESSTASLQYGIRGSYREGTSRPISARVGEHSLRSGIVTEGGRKGIALPALMAMTGYRVKGSVIGYFQAGGVPANPAARMLDDRPAL